MFKIPAPAPRYLFEILKPVAIVAGFILLAACTVTYPVAVIGENGEVMRGTTTASLGSGSFSVSDGKITCAGSYDSSDRSITISMPVLCSDGRKGIIIVTRNRNLQSGSGRVRMDDGTEADFIFGEAAAAF